MAHYKLILAYEGTAYAGFQRQAHKATVQSTVEDALRKLGWQGRAIMASGRTDSGVHALGQVISFNFDWKHGTSKLVKALNAKLPSDVVAQHATEVPWDFHPRLRRSATRIPLLGFIFSLSGPLRDAFARRRRWQRAPNLSLMNEAACPCHFRKPRFSNFGGALKEHDTTREIFEVDWKSAGDEQHFTIIGNAFLYHGTAYRRTYSVGGGRASVEIVKKGLT